MAFTGKNVEDRVFYIAGQLGFDLRQYLRIHNRQMWGVLIDIDTNQFLHFFGNPPAHFLPTINQSFVHSEAGYKVDVGSHFTDLGVNADVFLISKDRLNDSLEDIDSLIVHELCHMLIDSEYLVNTNVRIDSKDRHQGKVLRSKVDKDPARRHDRKFCNLLAALAEDLANINKRFVDRWDIINRAMKHGDML